MTVVGAYIVVVACRALMAGAGFGCVLVGLVELM